MSKGNEMRLLSTAVFAAVFFLASNIANSETITEMAMPTDVGAIVLTMQPCPEKNEHGFEYFGYATDAGNPVHPGCWNADAEKVYIWFPEISAVGVYAKHLFKPNSKI